MWGPKPIAVEFERVVLAAHVPFVCFHLFSLYELRPYYRFLPCWLAVVAWLVWKRWPRGEVDVGQSSGRPLLQAALVCLFASVWYVSPPLGATAAVISLAALTVRLKGRAALRTLAGAWALLWLLAPPVLGVGEWLVERLRTQTARTGSRILESLEVDHFLAGTSLQLPRQDIAAAEACGGVHSPLLLIAIAMLLAVLLRRGWVHGLLLTGTGVFWTFVLHSTRVVIVVANSHSESSLSGWLHAGLGCVMLVFGVLLLLSTDRLLLNLLAPVFVAWSHETQQDPLSRFWNRAVAGPGTPPEESELFGRRSRRASRRRRPPMPLATIKLRVRSELQRAWRWCITPDQALPPPPAHLSSPVEPDEKTAAWAVSFGCLGAVQLLMVLVLQTPRVSALASSGAFQERWLPTTIAGWQSTDHHSVRRHRCSSDGHFSRSWEFRSGDQAATVSVDFPFRGWHSLEERYRAKGWTVLTRTVTPAESADFVAVRMNAPTGEYGYLLYSLFNGATRPVEPRTPERAATRRKWFQAPLFALLGGRGSADVLTRGTVQIQQLTTDRYPLTEQQQRNAERLYVDLRERLVAQWREKIGERNDR